MMQGREMKNTLLIAALASLTALLAVAVARAATTGTITVNAVVAAGATLSIAPVGSPSFNLTLTGVDQVATYTLPVIIVDARGLAVGGGWNLTVTSTQFKDASAHTFPTTASTITLVTPSCGTSSTCTLPTNNVVNTNLAVPAAAVAPAAVKYENAATATGLGTTNVNATVSVAVPSNVFAGTYTSTVTVSIIAGP
jgi:hypothetical protein